MATELGFRLEGRSRKRLTPDEIETYVPKSDEVYEFHFSGGQPLFSQERFRSYVDDMLALKNDHPEFALHYLSLEMAGTETKIIVQTSVLPTEEVKPLGIWFVLGALAVAITLIAGAHFVEKAGPFTLDTIDRLRDIFAPEPPEKKPLEEELDMSFGKKAETDEEIHNLRTRKEDIEAIFDELGIPYIPEGSPGEVTLTPEEIAALPPEQRKLIAEYKRLNVDIPAKKETSKFWGAEIERIKKALAALPGRKPRWWLIGGILGVAGLAAATGLIRTLKKD